LAQFLSDEYMTAATGALGSHPGFMNAIADVELDLQFVVTEAPDGDIDYRLAIKDGAATLELGTGDDPDVTVTNTYETAVGISTGELNTQMAFMTGKLKVAGNMAALMRHQGVINQFAAALSSLEVEY
jgi:putative sterol carrier protein